MSPHPARQLNSKDIINGLKSNLMPLIKKDDSVTAYRIVFSEENKLKITNVRYVLDDILANLNLKFFVSCISEKLLRNLELKNHLPCRLHCNDARIAKSFANASKNLHKLKHMCEFLDSIKELPEVPPSGPLSKAAHKISALMTKLNYRLYRGMVYAKPEEAKFTFKLVCDADEFLNKLQTNQSLRECILSNQTNLLKQMSNIHTVLFPRIKINYDYIEVKNNQYLKLSSRAYVACPFTDDEFGVISPRNFFNFDPFRTECHGGYLASAIAHWFPSLPDQVDLAHRIYQCLLCHQFPDKTKKLTLVGKIDSGKTSLMNLFSSIIPKEKIAILTKESTFGLSMINDDTELLFVDEWSKEMTPPDIAKTLFQNGRFPQAVKFKTPRMQTMQAGVFLTCNEKPKFDTQCDQESVERRLAIFETRALSTLDPAAPGWIKDNAMNCLTYIMNLVNNNIEMIDKDDLSYTLPVNVKCESTVLKENLDQKQLEGIQTCLIDQDKSVGLAESPIDGLEIFHLEEFDVDKQSETCGSQQLDDVDLVTTKRPMKDDQFDTESLIGFISTTDVDSDIEPPKKRARKNWFNSPQRETDKDAVESVVEYLVRNVSSKDVNGSSTLKTQTNTMPTQDAVESPIKDKTFIKSPRRFKVEDINKPEYWRMVRSYLHHNLKFKTLNGPVAHSLFRLFEKFEGALKSPRPPTMADPKLDASFLVINKQRPNFNVSGFLKKYPSCVNTIKDIRGKIGVRYSSSIL
ncbi:uncharacterized protein [Clytia hemisphaerica]|uniref:uncharacterized protein n=2 Tax=Clytia hemisphaerica TaxID=252671 RepID=UPI0034D44271